MFRTLMFRAPVAATPAKCRSIPTQFPTRQRLKADPGRRDPTGLELPNQGLSVTVARTRN